MKRCHNLSIKIRLAQWRVLPFTDGFPPSPHPPFNNKKRKRRGELVLSYSSSTGPVAQGNTKENSEEAQAEQFFGKYGLFPWEMFYKLHWPRVPFPM